MEGRIVKEKLLDAGYTLRKIATDIGTTPQNFNILMNSVDVKSGTLERICYAINKTIDFFYADDELLAPKIDVAGYGKVVLLETYEKKVEECALLRAKIKELTTNQTPENDK